MVPTSSIPSADHHVHSLLLRLRFSSFVVWALLCPMTRGTTYEATHMLPFILLLLLECSSLLWLVVILVLLAIALAMLLWLVHHVGTGLTLRSF
jgi:hypothetical protein